jgi:hypothetical protein
MYFGAQADAGLTRGTLAAGLGLFLWLAIGAAIVKWYDRKRFYRLHPDLLAHVNNAIQEFRAQHGPPAPASSGVQRSSGAERPSGAERSSGAGRPPGTEADPERPTVQG